MDYEKLYKEALSRARQFSEHPLQEDSDSIVEYIFPELKESEDERTRKKVIEYMKTGTYNRDYIRYAGKYSHEIWRKLMDNFKNIKDYHIECNEVSDIVLNAIIDTFNWLEKGGDKNKVSKHVEAINEEKVDDANKVEPKDYSSIDPHFGKPIDKVEIKEVTCTQEVEVGNGNINALVTEEIPIDKVEPKFKVGDTMRTLQEASNGITDGVPVVVSIDNEYYHCNNEIIAIKDQNNYEYPPINKKPADKVEPKFHEGDWIVQGYNILKIKCVGNTHYCFETVGGYVDDMLISEIDSQFHLWTIADAKNGDVLIEDSCIFIIQKLGDNSTAAKTYCTLYNDGDFNDGSILYFDIDSTKPATKEQRDTLERAMADAGYTFDFESKELKKIEQLPAGWSEEDENIKQWIISDIEKLFSLNKKSSIISDKEIIWLKSLKDRVGCAICFTTTKEWNESDKEEFQIAIDTLVKAGQHDSAHWLKSLKQRIGG